MKMNLKAKVGDVGDILDLPQDALRDISKITIYGSKAICIENHGGIKFYTDKELIINTTEGDININGINISITRFDEENIIVEGTISSIILEPRG